jgi:1-deoxyxylulose-5-phosphate synthase
MSQIARRQFLGIAGGAALAGGLARPAAAAILPGGLSPDADVPPPPQVPLGKTGITLSRVGQGTGMNGGDRQSNHTRMGIENFTKLLRNSWDRGVTFFDMADMYGTHIYFREAIRTVKSIPREKLTILTKLWWRFDGEPKDGPAEYQKKSTATALERFRHELMTDYIDIVLLHCLVSGDWTKEMGAYMDALSEAKAKKQVRALGVSCHDFNALKAAADSPWVDVILARINPDGKHMDAKTDEVIEVLRRAKANGKAILGMKIYGQGDLRGKTDECMKFAQGLGLLDAMTIGAEKPEEMDETLRLLAKHPAKTA